jgi:hypothetical protein
MSAPKCTPGRLSVYGDANQHVRTDPGKSEFRLYKINHQGDAARIVACVNACEGIEDPAAALALVRTLAGLSFPHELSGDDDSIEALTSLIRQARKISSAPAAPSNPVLEAASLFNAEQGFPADHGPHSGDGALAVQEVHEAPTCEECGGSGGDCDAGDDGQTVSWNCPSCGGSGEAPKAEHSHMCMCAECRGTEPHEPGVPA